MQIEESRDGDVVVLSIVGRLDHAGAAVFDERVSRHIADGDRRFVIDFHGVDFVASMGIRAIIKPYQAVAPLGGRIAVVHLSPTIRQVFHIAAIDQVVPVVDSLEEAIAAVRG